ncbi:MAG: DUF115 domain-containing protein [Treponema sp.]|nr:DUF115 domain-containing protein [Treponema sp.]
MVIPDKENQGEVPLEGPVEIPAQRGFSISYKGKTLLSKIDPIAQAEKIIAEVPILEECLYFFPSPLYGYGLSVLLEKLKPGSAIICVEADDSLFEISKKSFSGFQGKSMCPALLHAKDAVSLCTFVNKTWGKRRFRRVETVHLGGGRLLYPELYSSLEKALRREIAVEWSNAMTLIRLGRLYTRNLIRNLALLPNSKNISSLNYASSPILVLGAGPSLDALLDELENLFGGRLPGPKERQFKIICVDTCLIALIERSIIPDLVIILESQHWNLKDFTGLMGRKIDAALDLSALPASARVLAGERYFFSTLWTDLRLFDRLKQKSFFPQVFPPLGSVGISGVAIALKISSGPVLAGGIDFSYSLDAYHALFTPGDRENRLKQSRLRGLVNAAAVLKEGSFIVRSKDGSTLRSEPGMRNYRELFEQQFGAEERLFDIGPTGLHLGVKNISLKEAISILKCKSNIRTTGDTGIAGDYSEEIIDFIKLELCDLIKLKDLLSGAVPMDTVLLQDLIEKTDYLWAHFPEAAGAGGRHPPLTDVSFLKRVRTEIDPFAKLMEMSLGELK